jgi:hypothetical protein
MTKRDLSKLTIGNEEMSIPSISSSISRSWIHYPNFIAAGKLAETKLPEYHARQERIEELKEMGKTSDNHPGLGFYLAYQIDRLEGFTDELYRGHIEILSKIKGVELKQSNKDKVLVLAEIFRSMLKDNVSFKSSQVVATVSLFMRDGLKYGTKRECIGGFSQVLFESSDIITSLPEEEQKETLRKVSDVIMDIYDMGEKTKYPESIQLMILEKHLAEGKLDVMFASKLTHADEFKIAVHYINNVF